MGVIVNLTKHNYIWNLVKNDQKTSDQNQEMIKERYKNHRVTS